MSIQRYRVGPDHLTAATEDEVGKWVTYADHVAAVEFAEEAEGRSWQQAVEELVTRAEQAEAALDQMTVDHIAELLTLGTKARAAGLQEARKAVVNVHPGWPTEIQMQGVSFLNRVMLLAAIDALAEGEQA